MNKLITTSWDDGYPLDWKLAELLNKYNLPGTFYIPKTNTEYEVMDEYSIIDLSKQFEIGGHTMNHVRISEDSKPTLYQRDCRLLSLAHRPAWTTAGIFLLSGGVFNNAAVEFTLQSGFQIIRTTELLNPGLTQKGSVFPTTIQVYNHSGFTYIKHLLLRSKFESLRIFFKIGNTNQLSKMVENYIEQILSYGGCFHLWGHSWEIEKFGLWNQLEEMLQLMSGIAEAKYITNAQLINYK